MCGGKNENHDFWKLGGLNPLKCYQSDVENVWEQKELIFVCLVHSQVWWFWLDFVTWWCVGWQTKMMVSEKWFDSNLTNSSKVMWGKFGSKRNWSWHGWCYAKFGDFARFCDFVVCGLKNKNHGFGKVAGLKAHKCLQSDVGKVWEQKELNLAWLVLSQVWWFG